MNPVRGIINSLVVDSPLPSNLTYLWGFGSILGLSLVIQILTGVFLAMHYVPDTALAFMSVEHIMRDTVNGWILRYAHANGAGMFFIGAAGEGQEEELTCTVSLGLLLKCLRSNNWGSVKPNKITGLKALIGKRRSVGITPYSKSSDAQMIMLRMTNLNNQLVGDERPAAQRSGIEKPSVVGMGDAMSTCIRVTTTTTHIRGDNWQGAKIRVQLTKTNLGKPGEVTATFKLLESGLGGFRVAWRGNSHQGAKGSRCLLNKIVIGVSSVKTAQCFGCGRKYYSTQTTGETGRYNYNEVLRRGLEKGKYTNLYSIMCDTKYLMMCYEGIKSKPGNMTKGTDKETLDKIDTQWFRDLGERLKEGKFKFRPVRLVPRGGEQSACKGTLVVSGGVIREWSIHKEGNHSPLRAKHKGGTRPLGVGSPRDKIIQKGIQGILEGIYEPRLSDKSSGLRPNRGTHTALLQVRLKGKTHPWVIKGDIKKCFDMIPHSVIIENLKKKINDERFMELIMNHLKAGVKLPNGDIRKESRGVPQGSVVSPVISNVVLHELDKFMDKYKEKYDKGALKGKNKEYIEAYNKLRRVKRRVNQACLPLWRQTRRGELGEEAKKSNLYGKVSLPTGVMGPRGLAMRRMRDIPANNLFNEEYRRIEYVRYADDFVIFVTGPLKEVKEIRELIRNEIKKRCGLELNMEKTTIQKTTKWFEFLGATCRNMKWSERPYRVNKRGERRKIGTLMVVCAPILRLKEKLKEAGYVKDSLNFNPTAKRNLVWLPHDKILQHYNRKIRGILNYYTFAGNRSSLAKIEGLLRLSCALTLALKYKLKTMAKVFKVYGRDLTCEKTGYKLYRSGTLRAIHKFKGKTKI